MLHAFSMISVRREVRRRVNSKRCEPESVSAAPADCHATAMADRNAHRTAILERRLVEEFDDNLDSALQSTGVYQPPGLDNQGPTPVSEISNVMESSGERPDVSNRDLLMESDSVDDMSVASPIRAAGSGENDADALLLNLPNLPSCEQSTAPPTRESIRQSLINGREDLDLVQADLYVSSALVNTRAYQANLNNKHTEISCTLTGYIPSSQLFTNRATSAGRAR